MGTGYKCKNLREKAYGDASVGYVQLKRKNNVCVVKCQICPEHGVRSQNYSIILEVDKSEENKVKAECQDCAAPTGGCKHAIAFVMWVHRRSEEPSPTEHTLAVRSCDVKQPLTSLLSMSGVDEQTEIKIRQLLEETTLSDKLPKESPPIDETQIRSKIYASTERIPNGGKLGPRYKEPFKIFACLPNERYAMKRPNGFRHTEAGQDQLGNCPENTEKSTVPIGS
ncbi:hypothetical protein HUJ05_003290 [Dendroctonus ponderosae]|nr:hypothetical protein HUJ05_003290 [Dendroctonus ponderosae]